MALSKAFLLSLPLVIVISSCGGGGGSSDTATAPLAVTAPTQPPVNESEPESEPEVEVVVKPEPEPEPEVVVGPELSDTIIVSETEPTSNPSDPFSSAPTISGTIDGLSYSLWSIPGDLWYPYGSPEYAEGIRTKAELKADLFSRNNELNPDLRGWMHFSRGLRRNGARSGTVTYQSDDGFRGFYRHSNGNTGTMTSDVELKLVLSSYPNGSLGSTVEELKIGVNNPIIIEGENLGAIDTFEYVSSVRPSNGRFMAGYYPIAYGEEREVGFLSKKPYSHGSVTGVFSDQFTTEGYPRLVGGEVEVWYGEYVDADKYYERFKNSLVGVFIADVVEE